MSSRPPEGSCGPRSPSSEPTHGYRALTRIVCEGMAAALFATVLVLQAWNIALRYSPVGAPWMWVEDFTRYALIWMFFLLWHLDDRDGSHFTVGFAVERLPRRLLRCFALGGDAVAILFAIAVIWSSCAFIPTAMGYRTNSCWLPMGAVYLVVPVGLTLVLVERIRLLVERIRR